MTGLAQAARLNVLAGFIILALAAPTDAAQGYAPWLVKDNFEESLSLYTTVSEDCPITDAEIRSSAEGEFLRARLIPQNNPAFALDVSIECVPNRIGDRTVGYTAHTWIRFSTFEGLEIGQRDYLKHRESGLVTLGPDEADKAFLLNAIKTRVSDALTTYLRANLQN